MKYEITKGSEKDFDGAPEWATLLLKGRFAAKAWASSYSNGAKALTPGTTDKYIIDAIEDCTIIAERRPITEPAWDGEWLPPVGVRCEFIRAIHWYVVEILYISGYHVVVKGEDGAEQCYQTSACQFRPIRSPEDVARDEVAKGLVNFLDSETDRDNPFHEHELIEFYDYVAAGKIPGITLSGK